jgi:hypothetical protein
MIKYQNYKHYKLPITMNPLEYGKLIIQLGKNFIVQINRTNIALINKNDELNKVKLFKEGDLMFEYTDIIINESTFERHLLNKKFTFKNKELISLNIENILNRILINIHKWNTMQLIICCSQENFFLIIPIHRC